MTGFLNHVAFSALLQSARCPYSMWVLLLGVMQGTMVKSYAGLPMLNFQQAMYPVILSKPHGA